jgi:iron complex outermembrane receptor protein
MTIGQPDLKWALVVNAEYPFLKHNIVCFGDVLEKELVLLYIERLTGFRSKQLLRSRTTYNGFQPTFETDIFDNLGSIGIRSTVFGFNADFSLTAGSNKVDYTVGNTLNVSLGANSPTEFNVGGYTFSQLVGNADFRTFDKVTFGFGTELEGTI